MLCRDPYRSLSWITQEVEEVTEDGAPSGIKDYIVWDLPFVDDQAPQLGRNSSISEATGLMRFLMKRGIRVILFCKVSWRGLGCNNVSSCSSTCILDPQSVRVGGVWLHLFCRRLLTL